MISPYIRHSILSIEFILSLIPTLENKKPKKQIVNGILVKMTSQRYKLFKEKGCDCVSCGVKGSFFAIEKTKGQADETYHLNLYAIDNNGNQVLMTKDHILPKSKGGKNSLINYQPMCVICNNLKSDKISF